MKISELNERALIEHIEGLLASPEKKTVVGAGEDDCAVLDRLADRVDVGGREP
jgi:thiamine monophosphate kinase